MSIYVIEEFEHIKRKFYIIILPFVIIASVVGFCMELVNNDLDLINKFNLPIMFCWFSYVFVSILIKKKLYYFMELVTFSIISLMHLVKFSFVLFKDLESESQYTLGDYVDWVPLIFIFIFFTFRGKKALVISFLLFGVSLLIGIQRISAGAILNGQMLDTLIQFYLSNLVLFLFLFFLQKLLEVYMHAESVQELANTDYLTGLPNRRMMDERLHNLIENAANNNRTFSIVLIDIDFFKKINDNFGHNIGDAVLVEFSEVIKNNITSLEQFGRWGGEEFIIISSNHKAKETCMLSEQLRRIIQDHSFPYVGNITASFGVTESKPGDLPQSILKRADELLYQAKSIGRNCVVTNQ